MPRRLAVTFSLLCLIISPIIALALAQPEQTRQMYLPQLGNGPAPTVIVSHNMVTILAVGPRAAQDPADMQQILLRNETGAPIYLGGWTVRNVLRSTPTLYRFPPYELSAGQTIAVVSGVGPGNIAAGIFPWGEPAPIWQTGDVAELRTPAGELVSWLVVPLLPEPLAPTSMPTITPTSHSFVELNDIVLKDPAFPNESEEYVQIRNAGDMPVNLAGWRLSNGSRPGQTPAYIFPSFTLGVDVTIAVFSAIGDDELDVGDFYWNQPREIWQVGDRAELRDAQNNLVATLVVPNQ